MRNLDKWWFVGMESPETAGWFPYTVNGAADITNQYLVFGINAGILAIVLFVAFISKLFGQVGRALAKIRSSGGPARTGFMLWGLGAMLVVHVVTWFGVSYFDQVYVVWLLEMAATVSIANEVLSRSRTINPGVPQSSARPPARHPEPVGSW